MDYKFSLSICIPTRNRIEVLTQTIDSIIEDPAFDERVQIVVSDNASDDATEHIMGKYVGKYPNNIKYNRNPANLTADYNFTKVMELGQGRLLKLHNDYSRFLPGALAYLKQIVEDNKVEQPIIFLSNGNITMDSDYIEVSGLDSFVDKVSNVMSWIGCYTMWNDQFETLTDRNKYAALNFVQIDWIFRLIAQEQKVLIYDKILTERLKFNTPQSGYNFFGAHIRNYLQMQRPYVTSGKLSTQTYYNDKVKIYPFNIDFAYKLLAYQEKEYAFDLRGSWGILIRAYWNYPRFYYDLCKIITIRIMRWLGILGWIKKLKKRLSK